MSFETYKSAKELPACWDRLAGENLYLKRKQLEILESVNPCGQAYTIFSCPEPDSLLVTYRLKLDIFTYSRVSLKLPVVIAGIPCSVSSCGYVAGENTEVQLFDYLRNLKGAKLVLNSGDIFKAEGFARGLTLPSCRLDMRWSSFEDYLLDMRSHYRYRLGKAIGRFSGIRQSMLADNSLFDDSLYSLYENVYNKSEFKLEKLPISFFREFPSRIIAFYLEKKPVAFVQMAENGSELAFLFGGMDYSLNMRYDIYTNMLIAIMRHGIEKGFKTVELGQTAEDTKQKLGGDPVIKYMYVNHSNSFINLLVKRGISILSYRPRGLSFNVFKEAGK
ncbi:MAG: GNAT family N-acetyltransferase [Pseudomonadota bacterium]